MQGRDIHLVLPPSLHMYLTIHALLTAITALSDNGNSRHDLHLDHEAPSPCSPVFSYSLSAKRELSVNYLPGYSSLHCL
mgnify:CR=1 FL=1